MKASTSSPSLERDMTHPRISPVIGWHGLLRFWLLVGDISLLTIFFGMTELKREFL